MSTSWDHQLLKIFALFWLGIGALTVSQGVASLQASNLSAKLASFLSNDLKRSSVETKDADTKNADTKDNQAFFEDRGQTIQALIRPRSIAELESTLSGGTSEQLAMAAQLMRETADLQSNLSERIRYMCRSRELYELALRQTPYASTQLINWANLQQLLGNTRCEGDSDGSAKNGAYGVAVELAVSAEPSNPRVLFAAGLMAARAGDKTTALERFNTVLAIQASRISAQESAMLEQIQSGRDVEILVPARFPQVVTWSELLAERLKREAKTAEVLEKAISDPISSALARLQLAAISASRKELDAGEISIFTHTDRLLTLFNLGLHESALILGDDVRASLDQELRNVIDKEGGRLNFTPEARELLQRRENLKSLNVLATTSASDTRAAKSPLVQWESSQALWFDEFYRTVGFYLPKGEDVSLIELVGYGSLREFNPDLIEVFGSNDNQNWEAIKRSKKTVKATLGSSAIISIPVTEGSFRYWKVNFASALRQRRFQGELQSMLRVYGSDRPDLTVSGKEVD